MCEFHSAGSYGVPNLLYVVVDSFVLAVHVFQESWTPGNIQAGYLGSQMRAKGEEGVRMEEDFCSYLVGNICPL
jgi:hypothetical protein